MSSPAPIAVFVYNRPSHTEQTLSYLRQNTESRDSDLTIFSDGPRSTADERAVRETRELIAGAQGFRSVRVVNRPENRGLARSIISGVTELLQTSDRVIVLEDDMVTSPYFLQYMNAALERYANEDAVGSVHAYMYPIEGLPDFFFMRGADCWGWATWRDRWRLFDADGRRLLRLLKTNGLLRQFDKTGGNHMVRMLIDQIRGRNSSWFIRWHASLFLNGKLTLQPGRSFVRNIGVDSSGTHCTTTDYFDALPRETFSGLPSLELVENRQAVEQIHHFFEGLPKTPWYRRFAREVLDEIHLWQSVH